MKSFYKISGTLVAYLLLSFSSSAQNQYGNWTITGPVAFPTFISDQINGMGRVVQMKFHPTDSLKMYAVSAGGGLWISSDGGSNWKKTGTDKYLPPTHCASVCVDYLNPDIIYLSTGDPNYYSDGWYSGGYGMFKSVDGGVSWFPFGNGLDNHMAVEILMHPSNNNTLIAATTDGIYKSTDAGANWIVKKAGGQFNDLVFKPGSSTIMYAVDTNSFWRSTNTGETWTKIASINPVIGSGGKIAVSAASPGTVYVGFVGSNTISGGLGIGGIIYRSTNSGQSFTLRKGDVNPNLGGYNANDPGQARYNWTIYADRLNASILYACGHIIWKSTNGGLTWTKLTDWFEKCHTDMHQMASSPYNNNKLFNANDGGIFLSTDGGNNWVPSCDGLSATEVYHLGQSNLAKNIADIGTQDNGEIYFETNTWYTNRGGDLTTPITFDYNKPNTSYYVDAGVGYAPYRRDLVPVSGSVGSNFGLTLSSPNDKYAFTSKNKNLAYVSQGTKLKRSKNLSNALPTWKKLKTFETNITAVAISPKNNNQVYVILDNQKIFYSSNALSSSTPTFTQVSTAPAATNINSNIVVNKNNTNIVYMTCGSRVYRSANMAVSWTDISGTLPQINIIDMLHDPNSSNESFYVASAIGVYYKNKTMGDWQTFSKGLPTIAQISNLAGYFEGTNSLLRVSFTGRGVWQSPIFGTCNDVNLSLTLDTYPQETSWDVKDEGGNVVASSGGTYAGSALGSTVIEPLCLVAGCYTFTIYDAYGDGICCGYGNGSYSLTAGTSTIKTGGSFGLSDSIHFCVPYPGTQKHVNNITDAIAKDKLSESADNSIKIFPNPAKQNANIVISSKENITALMRVTNADGKVILFRKQELVKGSNTVGLDLKNFLPGMYYVLVKTGETTVTKKLVVLQ